MGRLVTILALCVLLPLSAEADERADALAAISRANACRSSLTMDFVQTVSSPMLQAPLRSRGTITYKAPGFMEIRTSEPEAKAVVLDSLQVLRYAPKASVTEFPDPKAFEIRSFERSGKSWKMTLAPRRRDMRQLFAEIVLLFDPATWNPVSLEMRDTTGKITSLELIF